MSQSLDQLVKGAPAPSPKAAASIPAPDPEPSQSYLQPTPDASQSHPPAPDPLSTLPSSPSQIYLNLLILEASLRAQYLCLRERRRQNTFFLLVLAAWITYFSYALFLRPREDGSGVGGSIYWMVETGEKVALIGGVVTALLVWGTGQWERGIRWPRRWLTVTNRGLRHMNTKIIVIRGPLWKELLSYLSFIFPFFPSPAGNFHYVERHLVEKRGGGGRPHHHHQTHHHHHPHLGENENDLVEEDLSPGGDYIQLLLLPKSFSPEFRERWDEYRSSFWEKENERRIQLREKLRDRERQIARRDGGCFWWFGLWWKIPRRRKPVTPTAASSVGLSETPHRHRRRSSVPKAGHDIKHGSSRRSVRSESQSQSRNSSRSSTPVDGSGGVSDERPPSRGGQGRRGSATLSPPSQGGEQGRQRARSTRGSRGLPRGLSPLAQAQIREGLYPPQLSDDPFSSVGLGLRGSHDENAKEHEFQERA